MPVLVNKVLLKKMQINNIDDVRRITVPKDLKKLF
jgi:hypothetical protein